MKNPDYTVVEGASSSLVNPSPEAIQNADVDISGSAALEALSAACMALTSWAATREKSKMSTSIITSVGREVEDLIKVLSSRIH